MTSFTAKGALLTGAELIRRRPLLVLLWASVLLAETIAVAVTREEYLGWAQERINPWGSGGAFNGLLLLYTLGATTLALVLTSVLWTSAFRALMRPAARVPLSFGLEELSVFATSFIIQVIAGALSASLPVLLVSHFNDLNARMISPAEAVIGVIAFFWSAVASAWAFAKLRVAPFRSWAIVRGRFWRLAALVICVAILQRLANFAAHQWVLTLYRNPMFAPRHSANPFPSTGDRVEAVFQAPGLLQGATLAVIGALTIAFVAGIVTCAYRASLEDPQAAKFPTGSAAATS